MTIPTATPLNFTIPPNGSFLIDDRKKKRNGKNEVMNRVQTTYDFNQYINLLLTKRYAILNFQLKLDNKIQRESMTHEC